MAVVFSAPDTFGRLCAVYVCGCGRRAERYGREAGTLPAGWLRLGSGPKRAHACPSCAQAITDRPAGAPAG